MAFIIGTLLGFIAGVITGKWYYGRLRAQRRHY